MRCAPPVPVILRLAEGDLEVGGLPVPASPTWLASWARRHRDPREYGAAPSLRHRLPARSALRLPRSSNLPTVSWGGDRLAFYWDKGGRLELYVLDLADGAERTPRQVSHGEVPRAIKAGFAWDRAGQGDRLRQGRRRRRAARPVPHRRRDGRGDPAHARPHRPGVPGGVQPGRRLAHGDDQQAPPGRAGAPGAAESVEGATGRLGVHAADAVRLPRPWGPVERGRPADRLHHQRRRHRPQESGRVRDAPGRHRGAEGVQGAPGGAGHRGRVAPGRPAPRRDQRRLRRPPRGRPRRRQRHAAVAEP